MPTLALLTQRPDKAADLVHLSVAITGLLMAGVSPAALGAPAPQRVGAASA